MCPAGQEDGPDAAHAGGSQAGAGVLSPSGKQPNSGDTFVRGHNSDHTFSIRYLIILSQQFGHK